MFEREAREFQHFHLFMSRFTLEHRYVLSSNEKRATVRFHPTSAPSPSPSPSPRRAIASSPYVLVRVNLKRMLRVEALRSSTNHFTLLTCMFQTVVKNFNVWSIARTFGTRIFESTSLNWRRRARNP